MWLAHEKVFLWKHGGSPQFSTILPSLDSGKRVVANFIGHRYQRLAFGQLHDAESASWTCCLFETLTSPVVTFTYKMGTADLEILIHF